MEVKTIPVPSGRPAIQSYGPDGFRISGVLHQGPILVFSDGVVDWRVATSLSVDAFAQALERRGDFDLLLIGCGEARDGMEQRLAASLRGQGLPCEAMGTGAACRTYNLLAAEGRRVAAALLLPPR
jgi:uncharacterized protein